MLLVLAVVFSAAIQVNAQYCVPTITFPCAPEAISNVTYAGINNSSGCVAYTNYSAITGSVTQGQTNQISVTMTADASFGNDYVFVFIDWNQNQVWDIATERYLVVGPTSVSGTYSLNIAVPANATVGTTRLRVSNVYFLPAFNGCGAVGFGEIEDYNLTVNASAPPPPPPPTGPMGDLCANAIAIACGGSATNTTVGAAVDGPAASCTGGSVAPDVWYRITGDGGLFTANLCTGTAYDSKLDIYTGTCGAFTSVACNDDFCSLQSSVSWITTVGTVYYIRVHGFSGATGVFTLNVTCLPCPFPIQSPWTTLDINASGGAGLQACNGSFNVSAAGTGTSTADKGYFVYRSLSGNGYVTAQINSFTNFTFGGVAFRDGTTAGARHVGLFTQLGSRVTRSIRTVASGASSVALLAAPKNNWVRVARNGDVFTSYVSADGASWTQVNQVTVTGLPSSLNVGVFVYSQLATVGTVNFSNVTVTSGLPSATNGNVENRSAPQLNNVVVSAFPSPASNELNIRMGLFAGEKVEVNVFNLLGQLVINQTIDGAVETEKLDISKLTSGVYMLQINDSTPLKFAVEK